MLITSKNKKACYLILLLLIFLSAALIRLIDLDNPPLDFHPARQMHSAILARGFYLDTGGYLQDKTIEYNHEALMRGKNEPWIEPPVYEKITAGLYHLFGAADLRIPRTTSIIFWMLSVAILAILSYSLFGIAGMLGSVCFFLFLPYGISASRSFQPDIIMVFLLIMTMYCLHKFEPKSLKSAILLGLLSGACIFIKQVAIFPLGLAIAASIIAKDGLKAAIKSKNTFIVAFLSLSPVLVYNIWGCFISGFLKQQYQGRFFLSELISPSFYVRWLRMVDSVFSVFLFVLALIGILLIKNKNDRAAWIGYFSGYILYGLVLPHHIGTHDYYQLLAFPLVAVGIGSVASSLFSHLPDKKAKTAAIVLSSGLCLWCAADGVMTIHRTDYREWPDRWERIASELEAYDDQIITIGLMNDYGAGMDYWGLKLPAI